LTRVLSRELQKRTIEMSQHKATRRKSLRSAMAHRKLADTILDSIAQSQTQFNATMDKLNADTSAALDINYESSLAISSPVEFDNVESGAQHKVSLRKSLRSALAHKRLADEIADAVEEQQVAINALLVKLDAQAGVLADVNFVSTLGLEVIDADGAGSDAQHKVSLRKSLRSALAHRRLADEIIDAIVALQESMNDSLAALDAGSVNGAHVGFKVSELDPDA